MLLYMKLKHLLLPEFHPHLVSWLVTQLAVQMQPKTIHLTHILVLLLGVLYFVNHTVTQTMMKYSSVDSYFGHGPLGKDDGDNDDGNKKEGEVSILCDPLFPIEEESEHNNTDSSQTEKGEEGSNLSPMTNSSESIELTVVLPNAGDAQSDKGSSSSKLQQENTLKKSRKTKPSSSSSQKRSHFSKLVNLL
mmetsp:Transcript_6140/g.9148  ORF Transcript_6140/g.9148 Transcript_6140/m.9148 type:complete len:191 (+) Transcript_6140:682-1254(+)